MIEIPPYIAASQCQVAPLRYTWDDWELDKFESPLDDSLSTTLSGLSQRANVAWTIGCAEWIFFRLAPHLAGDILPLQRLEGAWAQVIDDRYSYSLVADPQDWAGPVKRPVLRALELVDFAVQAMARDDDPAEVGAAAATLAAHVLVDATLFNLWQARILERLQALYRRNPEETLGEVIPREVLDPDRPFDPSQTETLINTFLSSLPAGDNPFMLTGGELAKRGFGGVPYRFDIDADRDQRFRW